MGPQRRVVVLALVVGGVLSFSGCDSAAQSSESSDAPRPSLTASVSPRVPRDVGMAPRVVRRTPAEACGGELLEPTVFNAKAVRAYTPHGPAYDGPGPHPTEILRMDPDLNGTEGPELPARWGGYSPVQLVVCEYQDKNFKKREVGTCEYLGGTTLGGTAHVYSARYVYRVFEARTGTLLRTFTLPGVTTPEETCPDSAYAPAGALYDQKVESKTLVAKLRSLVEADR